MFKFHSCWTAGRMFTSKAWVVTPEKQTGLNTCARASVHPVGKPVNPSSSVLAGNGVVGAKVTLLACWNGGFAVSRLFTPLLSLKLDTAYAARTTVFFRNPGCQAIPMRGWKFVMPLYCLYRVGPQP